MNKTHRMLAAALALAVLLTLLPAATLAETVTGVTTTKCNFRTGPGQSYAQVAECKSIPKGASVTVLDNTTGGEYWKVAYKTYTGWIYGAYVKLNASGSGSTSGSTSSGASVGTTSGSLSGGTPSGTSGGPTSGSTSGGTTGSLGGGSSSGSTSGSTSGGTASNTTVYGVTTATCNFRIGSDTPSAKVSGCNTIPKGASVVILDNTSGGKYWKVNYKTYTGWIYGPYVKISSAPGGTTGGTSGGATSGTTGGTLSYASYTGSSADQWGYMQVDGTNISQAIYCNAIDKKGNFYYNAYSSSYNYFYALSYLTNPIAVIYGHNMRKSGTGMHQLHHVQNAWLGKAKCEYCGKDCSGAKTSVFNINYNGSSRWQLVGFFEASSSTVSSSTTRKNIQLMAAMQSYRTGAALQEWINYMMGYCNSSYKGATLGSMTSNDKVMVIVTCADSSGDSYQRMYMLLKAVG